MKFLLIFSGALIGLILSWQFASSITASTDVRLKEEEDFKKIYEELTQEQNRLTHELAILRKAEAEKKALLSQDIRQDLENAQKQAGFTPISGTGLSLRFTPTDEQKMSSETMASYLRDTVNLLLSLRAEAISINGYRIVFKTPILAVGDSILVQNFHISAPFEISVIGNTNFILSALEVREGLKEVREAVKRKELNLEVEKQTQMEIPAYIY